eukprot:jgi/Chlat1/3348/Chrsp23S03657
MKARRVGLDASRPIVRYSVASAVKKGEDQYVAHAKCYGPRSDGSSIEDYPFCCFAVFDGHGGRQAAEFCTDALVDNIMGSVALNKPFEDAVQAAVDIGFRRTHAEFKARCEPSGTTATMVIVDGWTVTVGWVGDSRAILVHEDSVDELTTDHRLEDHPAERQRCVSAGAMLERLHTPNGSEVGPLRAWPGGLCLSRSIGDVDTGPAIIAKPEVRQIRLPACGGRIIVATDGLWDFCTNKKVARVARHKTTNEAAPRIVKEVLSTAGLKDDITVMVVDVFPPLHPAARTADAPLFRRQPSRLQRALSFNSGKQVPAGFTEEDYAPYSDAETSIESNDGFVQDRLLHVGSVWCSECKAYTVHADAGVLVRVSSRRPLSCPNHGYQRADGLPPSQVVGSQLGVASA